MIRSSYGTAGLWAAFLLLSFITGCVKANVQTLTGADADLSRYGTVYVGPLVVREDALTQDEPVRNQLGLEAGRLFEELGYRQAAFDEADLEIQIEVQSEIVARRTWSSDPDASSYVIRDFPEAVLTLRAFEPISRQEVWRGEARSRLPSKDWIVGPSIEQVWMNALAEVVERFPGRPTPAREERIEG